MANELIVVDIDFSVGACTASHNVQYEFETSPTRAETGLKQLKPFLDFVFKGEYHNSIMVTVELYNSSGLPLQGFRFIHESHHNGYQKRHLNTFCRTAYPEAPSVVFGADGDSKKGMKKGINKTLKQILKQIQEKEELEVGQVKYALSKGGAVTEKGNIYKVVRREGNHVFLIDELIPSSHELEENIVNLIEIDEFTYKELETLLIADDYDDEKVQSILNRYL